MQSAVGESGCVPRHTVIAIETHIPWRRKKTKQIVHCGDAPCGNTYGTFRHVRHCALIALSHNRRSYMASLTPAFALWKMKGGVHLTAAVFRVLCVCMLHHTASSDQLPSKAPAARPNNTQAPTSHQTECIVVYRTLSFPHTKTISKTLFQQPFDEIHPHCIPPRPWICSVLLHPLSEVAGEKIVPCDTT